LEKKLQITDHIHAIKIPFQIPVAPGKAFGRFVYSYLVYDTEIYLIDSGVQSSDEAVAMMDEGLQYLQRIHEAVRKIAAKKLIEEPMTLCKEMVLKLGLPDVAVNPLIARSFMSHMGILDRQDLKVL